MPKSVQPVMEPQPKIKPTYQSMKAPPTNNKTAQNILVPNHTAPRKEKED
jgi:hypothetical protein